MGPLHLKTHIVFEMPEPIFMIFGTLQYRFILNTSVDLNFIKFIKQRRKLVSLILLSMNAKEG